MCGICGFTNARPEQRETLQAMCDIMAHRGPDGQGQYLADGIALGHRRLSLIDLEHGGQPMVRQDASPQSPVFSCAHAVQGSCHAQTPKGETGRYALVFNGEIYNYRDLAQELRARGYHLSTASDTEVLLAGYLVWGSAVLPKLRGMFAFALWDAQKQELFCARDFFGIKPFYYTQQDGQFIFASEIKSILEHPGYHRELNTEALEQYLCFEFSALPETFFKGIFKLAPGHCLTVGPSGKVTISRYWQPAFDYRKPWTEGDAVEAIDRTMRESVRYHNVADVEVGSFLSSGIDSSYLAACLANENPDIRTFTVGFAEYEGERDEISWARELAGQLGVQNSAHHITQDEYWQAVEKVMWHMDEPSADPSAVALYFVDKLASTQVKAVLSGEGADEFFAGYRIYQTPLAKQRVSWLPNGVLRGAASLLQAAHVRGGNYLERASERPEDWYYTNANGVAFSAAERERLLRGRLVAQSPQEVVAAAYAEGAEHDEITRMQYADIRHWLVDDILLKTDKMSMAHSLESRVPFMDREVFALAASIPPDLKVSPTQTKACLRKAAVRAIPKDWAEKEKLGFPVPLATWLRTDKRYAQVRQAFESETAARFFDTGYLISLLDEHLEGKDNSRKIWIAYAFLVWYGVFFR